MKLYYVPKTRASRPRWLLEELGVPYELVRLDPAKGETRTPEHLARHPLGHVPVLEDGDLRLFESGAICLYLADRFQDRGLMPPSGSPARALCYQWICYALTEIEPPFAAVGVQLRKPEAERDLRVIAVESERMSKAVAQLEPVLAKGPYLLGPTFSVADVTIGSMLSFARLRNVMPANPVFDAYIERIRARPAFQRANAD
jgi:glutathione S-transferase